jgi:hypothetical protein
MLSNIARTSAARRLPAFAPVARRGYADQNSFKCVIATAV